MKVNLDELNKRVDEKLISVQKHPRADLYIYNYTPIAQFGRNWDEYTLQARGLILDAEGNIVARPFSKFFNYAEHQGEDSKLPKLPFEEFKIYDKMDGSLGILYKNGEKYYLATRGSFTSDQAVIGSHILQQYLKDNPRLQFVSNWTYLFEIIYPQNRIVVDYGDMKDIVLLAIIDTETGKDVPVNPEAYPFPVVDQFPMQSIEELLKAERENCEGYVIRYESGVRVKIKHEEYVRLHRLLTQVSSKSIWELLKNGQDFTELLDNVPDEFYGWVKKIESDLSLAHADLLVKGRDLYLEIKDLPTRKDQAIAMKDTDKTIRSMVFALLDGKQELCVEIAWKAVKPGYEQPFKEDIDA